MGRLSHAAVVMGTVLAVGILVGCPDDEPIEFECDEHDQCLDDEACLGEVCTDAPRPEDDCPEEHEGDEYEGLSCEDGEWRLPPAPEIHSVEAQPPTVDPGETLELSVAAISEFDDELTFRWTAPEGWSLIDDDEPEVELVAHQQPGQTATIQVEVTDAYEQTANGEVTVSTHEDGGPEVQEINVDPEPAIPNEIQTINLDVYHPVQQPEELSFQWVIPEDDGWSAEGELEGPDIEVQAADQHQQTATVEVEVYDDEQRSATISTGVSTKENPGPTVEALVAEQTVLEPGGSTQVEVDASHELGHGIEEYNWTVSYDDDSWTYSVDEDDTIVEITAPEAYQESADVTVELVDDYGETMDETVTLHTEPEENEPPEILELYVDDNPVDADGETEVHVDAEDPMDFELSYDWSVDSDDDWVVEADTDEESTAVVEAPDEYGSTVEVSVEVSDIYGESAQEAIEVKTKTEENEAPIIEQVDVAQQVLFPEESTTVQVDAYDPYGLDLEYEWTVDDADWTLTPDGDDQPTAELEAPDAVDRQVELTVTVEDEEGETAEATETVETVESADPEIDQIDVDDNPVDPNATTQVEVIVTHPHGFEMDYDWSVDDDDWDIDGNGETAELTGPAEPNDSAVIEVEVSDDYGGEDDEWKSVETGDNEDPTITDLVAQQQVVAPGGSTTISADAEHPFDFDLNYDWSLDDSDWSIGSGQDSDEITLSAPNAPEATVEITLEVSDDFGGSYTDTTTVSTEDNEDPVITDLTADQTVDIDPDTTVDVEAEAYHPHGFDLSYQWELDNSEWEIVGDEDTSSVTLEAPDKPNSELQLTVIVTDDFDGEVEDDITLETIENDPPVIQSATASSDGGPYELGEEFTLNVDAYDPDGGSVTYLWSTDGAWDIDDETISTTDAWAPDHTETQNIVITVTDQWGYQTPETVEVETYDYAPDPFAFQDVTGAEFDEQVTSDEVTIDGMDDVSVSASCDGCELRFAGGEWAETVDGVENEDELQIRTVAADQFETDVTATLTVGDTESDVWTVTTKSAQDRVLSTCGNSGHLGPEPSDCDSAYEDEPHEGEVDVDDDGIQTWEAPADGIYEIEAIGAQGGGDDGGAGARVQGEVELSAGDSLQVLVGQRGVREYPGLDDCHDEDTNTPGYSGGGGTFVVDLADNPILVAGGGGGLGGSSEGDATVSEAGVDGVGNEASGDGGDPTEYGESASYTYFLTYNTTTISWTIEGWGGAGFETGEDGDAFVDGGRGGTEESVNGGFGGGASAAQCSGNQAGGGGGYSGGGAGLGSDDHDATTGGGGGSYNDADNPEEDAGYNDSGDGQVRILWVGEPE